VPADESSPAGNEAHREGFANHQTVAHTLGEYVGKDGETHTQTV
jgi:hypothetical protein